MGYVMAVKGLGGYHLAVDATNEAAVAILLLFFAAASGTRASC